MAANSRSLRLMEVFRTVFYTPIYVSVAGGFLETEGLDVTFRTCPPQFANVTSALNQGAADISGSGIMGSIISIDGGADHVPAHIAKINARDGSTAPISPAPLMATTRTPAPCRKARCLPRTASRSTARAG